MLRRRKKSQRQDRPPRAGAPGPRPAPEGAPRTRRRARVGAVVPAELRVDHPPPTPTPSTPTSPRPAKPKKPTPTPISGPGKSSPTPLVLLTGFDPFGSEELNPSWEICRQLGGREIAGMRVEVLKVPCEFRRSIEVVAGAIRDLQPAIVLCLGQAGGRAQMSVERIAINVDDARAADNGGAQPIDEAIAANGPAAYFATLPVKAMTAAMRAANVPAVVSNTAGTYVCNHLMYGVLHFLTASGTAARAGFIHVPYAEAQVMDKPAMPALSLETMVRGVEAAIAAAATQHADLKVSEGSLD